MTKFISTIELKEIKALAVGPVFRFSFSEERANKFLNEAHLYINNSNHEDLIAHTEMVLERIKKVLNTDQISGLEPILKDLVEADGIVMTSEVEIVDLVENYLSINLNINKNL